jgi:hypothetical protein
VIRKFIACIKHQEIKQKISTKITENFLNLVQNQHGNLVIQAAVEVNFLISFSHGMMKKFNL